MAPEQEVVKAPGMVPDEQKFEPRSKGISTARKKKPKELAVITECCTGCAGSPACVEYCPVEDCMFWVPDEDSPPFGRIQIDPILCIGCKKCERECPTRCIDMLDGPNDRKGKPIVIPEFDYTKCIGCQQCVDVCPVDCLHMEEIGYKDLEGFYHINLQGEVKLLEEQVEK